jgi:hypothetical protein
MKKPEKWGSVAPADNRILSHAYFSLTSGILQNLVQLAAPSRLLKNVGKTTTDPVSVESLTFCEPTPNSCHFQR